MQLNRRDKTDTAEKDGERRWKSREGGIKKRHPLTILVELMFDMEPKANKQMYLSYNTNNNMTFTQTNHH